MDETQIRQKMQQVVESVRQDISGIRTGRAMPSLVEDIMVEAYGGASRLKVVELASITAPDPHSLLISPWDKQVLGEIRKAIELANIGLNPISTGEAIRINLPPLTTEDREKYVKLLKEKLEHGKIMIRQVRQDGMHDIKKAHGDNNLSDDEKVQQEKNLQKQVDEFVSQIDKIGEVKETELRTM